MKELKTHFNVSCGDHAFSMKQRIDRKIGIKSLLLVQIGWAQVVVGFFLVQILETLNG